MMFKIIAIILLITTTSIAIAEETTKFIIFGPGSTIDILIRIIGRSLLRPIVVEAHPGAGVLTALQVFSKAEPDGNTFSVISSVAIAQSFFAPASAKFDLIKDFTPICLIAKTPIVMVSSSIQNVSDAIERAKTGKLTYAITGYGSISHINGISILGAKAIAVPFRTQTDLNMAVINGTVDVGISTIGPVKGLITSGTMKALIIGNTHRLSWIPNIPTMNELGLIDPPFWFAVFAPKGTSLEIVSKLRDEIRPIVTSLDYSKSLEILDIEAEYLDGQALTQKIEDEKKWYERFIKEHDLKNQVN